MSMIVTGIGTASPRVSVPQTVTYEATQEFCCDSDEHRRVMQLIYQGAGVEQRGTVAEQRSAPDGSRAIAVAGRVA